MKENIKNIIQESFEDEVDLGKEWNRLVSKITWGEAENTYLKSSRRKIFFQIIRYVAAVFIGFCVSSFVFYFSEPKPSVLVSSYKLATNKGEKSYLELPDGTKIWLNSCTTIEYAPDYGVSNRDIYLNGEAYFEVAKNKELPFVVKANGIDIKALGTAFNVNAYKEDKELITTLFSGKVEVYPESTRHKILLEPNQMAIYYKDKNKLEKKSYDDNLFVKWRDGALSFDMMYMKDITKLLERNFDVVFRYDNQDIKDLKFRGSFKNNETLSDILNVIKTNTSISYQIVGDTIIIK